MARLKARDLELANARLVDQTKVALKQAVANLNPTHIVSMVSGGRDSAASHAIASEVLGERIDLILHINTRCGIPETSQFVESYYGSLGPDFIVADAGTSYEDYVLRKGFFGKGRGAHNFAYRVLKATPLRKTISKCIRQRRRNIRVLLLNGARANESANRQNNLKVSRTDPAAPGNIWFNVIHDWAAMERDDYLNSRSVPLNPVAKALCRSGECMCGTMQSYAQRVEAACVYPSWGDWLDQLEAEVKAKHGFGWGEPFPRKQDAGQRDLFEPMCVGCKENT